MANVGRQRSRHREESISRRFAADEIRDQQKAKTRSPKSRSCFAGQIVSPPKEVRCCSGWVLEAARRRQKNSTGKQITCKHWERIRASYSATGVAPQPANSSSSCRKQTLPFPRCRSASPDPCWPWTPLVSPSYSDTSVLSGTALESQDSTESFRSLVECPVSGSWRDSCGLDQFSVCPLTQVSRVKEKDVDDSRGARQRGVRDNDWIQNPYRTSLSDNELFTSTVNSLRKFRRFRNHPSRTAFGKASAWISDELPKSDGTYNYTDTLNTRSNCIPLDTNVCSFSAADRHWRHVDSDTGRSHCHQRFMDRCSETDDRCVGDENDGRWTPSPGRIGSPLCEVHDCALATPNDWKEMDDLNPYMHYDGMDYNGLNSSSCGGVFDGTYRSYTFLDRCDYRISEVTLHNETNVQEVSKRIRECYRREDFASSQQKRSLTGSQLSTETTSRRALRGDSTEDKKSDSSYISQKSKKKSAIAESEFESSSVSDNPVDRRSKSRRPHERSLVKTKKYKETDSETEETSGVSDSSDSKYSGANSSKQRKNKHIFAKRSTGWSSSASLDGQSSKDSCLLSSYCANSLIQNPMTLSSCPMQDEPLQLSNCEVTSEEAKNCASKPSVTEEESCGNETSLVNTSLTDIECAGGSHGSRAQSPSNLLNRLNQAGTYVPAKEIATLEDIHYRTESEGDKATLEAGIDRAELAEKLKRLEAEYDITEPVKKMKTPEAELDFTQPTFEPELQWAELERGTSSIGYGDPQLMTISGEYTPTASDMYLEDIPESADPELSVPSESTSSNRQNGQQLMTSTSVVPPGLNTNTLPPSYIDDSYWSQLTLDDMIGQSRSLSVTPEEVLSEEEASLVPSKSRLVRTKSPIAFHLTDGIKPLPAIPENDSVSSHNDNDSTKSADLASRGASDKHIQATIQSPLTFNQHSTIDKTTDEMAFKETLQVQEIQEDSTGQIPTRILGDRQARHEVMTDTAQMEAEEGNGPSMTSIAPTHEKQSTRVELQQTRIPRLRANVKLIPPPATSRIKVSPVPPLNLSDEQTTPTLLLQIQILSQETPHTSNRESARQISSGDIEMVPQSSRIPVRITTTGTQTSLTLLQLQPDSSRSRTASENDLKLHGSSTVTRHPRKDFQQSGQPGRAKDASQDQHLRNPAAERPPNEESEPTSTRAKEDIPADGDEDEKPLERVRSEIDLFRDSDENTVAGSFVEIKSRQMSENSMFPKVSSEVIQSSIIHGKLHSAEASLISMQQQQQQRPKDFELPISVDDDKQDTESPEDVKKYDKNLERLGWLRNTGQDENEGQSLTSEGAAATKPTARLSSKGSSSKIPVRITSSGMRTSLTHQFDSSSAVNGTEKSLQHFAAPKTDKDHVKPLSGSPNASKETTNPLLLPGSTETNKHGKDQLNEQSLSKLSKDAKQPDSTPQKSVSSETSSSRYGKKPLQPSGSPEASKHTKTDMKEPGSSKLQSPKALKDAKKNLQKQGVSDHMDALWQPSSQKTDEATHSDQKQRSSVKNDDSSGKKALSEVALRSAKGSPVKIANSTLGLISEATSPKDVVSGSSKRVGRDSGRHASMSSNDKADLSDLISKTKDKDKRPKPVKRSSKAETKQRIRKSPPRKPRVKVKLTDETKAKRRLREPKPRNSSVPEELTTSEAEILHNPFALTDDEDVLDRSADSSEETPPQWDDRGLSEGGPAGPVSILKKDKGNRRSIKNVSRKSMRLKFSEEVEVMFIEDDEYMDIELEDGDDAAETEDDN